MREHRVQIAVAIDTGDDDVVGIVALEDPLEEIIGGLHFFGSPSGDTNNWNYSTQEWMIVRPDDDSPPR
jgi:Mg2+/Co2+ transporter CorB